MSRRSRTAFGSPVNPELVSVTCARCGDSFTTDESTAYHADTTGGELLCADCKAGGQCAPSQAALENPTPDETREPRGPGPDAEPALEATIPEVIPFNELRRTKEFEITLTYGTEELGTVTASPGDKDGHSLPVELNPGLKALSDEAEDAVTSALSLHTQLLIDIQ